MKRIPCVLAGLALLSTTSIASAQTTLGLSVSPPNLGQGDNGTVIITGIPGDIPFLLTSLSPGPINLPIVGQVEVGLTGIDIVTFGTFPASGQVEFNCLLRCALGTTAIYMQAVSIGGQPFVLKGKSQQVVLVANLFIVNDCDANGVDDDCDIEDGNVPDCNGNAVPDECDISSGASSDVDADGLPDECCPDLCRLEAQFTFEGDIPTVPYLLSINVIVPGEPAAVDNLIEVSISSPLPTSVTSPNGAVTASGFTTTATGLTFSVSYEPDLAAGSFGTNLWLLGEIEGHCSKLTLSADMRSRCELAAGAIFPSANDPGDIVILSADSNCP